MIDVESADGFFDLDYNNNRGDDGDPFPGSSNNLTFNNLSNPSSTDYFSKYSAFFSFLDSVSRSCVV